MLKAEEDLVAESGRADAAARHGGRQHLLAAHGELQHLGEHHLPGRSHAKVSPTLLNLSTLLQKFKS